MKRFIENLYRHTLKHLFQFIWKIKTLRTAAARGLSLFLAVALIFSVLPPPAFALTEADFEVIWLDANYNDVYNFSEGLASVDKLSENIKLSLPVLKGDTKYQAVFNKKARWSAESTIR